MTRKKKTRSLKRIHQVKTGNKSKLKKQAQTDRQKKVNNKNRTKSVYEKFLDENPQVASEVASQQTQLNKQKELEKQMKDQQQAEEKVRQQEIESAKADKAPSDSDLLDQLDKKDINDIF